MACSRFICRTTLALIALSAGTAAAATRGIWMSPEEIRALPMSGGAWNNVRAAAYGSWGTPNLKVYNTHGVLAVAGALVYVRTGDPALRTKVADGILAAKRTCDTAAEYAGGATQLTLGRQLTSYVIAADLIDFETYDPDSNAAFAAWLDTAWTTILAQSNPSARSVFESAEIAPNNGGAVCGASRIAIDRYLGDTVDLARADSIFRAWGDRSYYPHNANRSVNGYFLLADRDNLLCCRGEPYWTAINPACVLNSADCPNGLNMDGAIVADLGRESSTGPDCSLQTVCCGGLSYTWLTIMGLTMQAEMLYRAGHNSFSYNRDQLKRTMQFILNVANGVTLNTMEFVPWVANYRYGTNFPTNSPVSHGEIFGWTDWTHGTAGGTSDGIPPAAIRDLSP